MTAFGSAQAFRAAYEAGKGALVWRESPADLETPVGAFLKIAHGKPFSFLLESVEGGASRGRYSVIAMEPDLIWRCEKGVAAVNRAALEQPGAFVPETAPALDSLRSLLAESRLDQPAGMPPMAGGLFGYLGYDMVRLMERLPEKNEDVLGIPEAILTRPTVFVIFDNVRDVMTLVAPAYPRVGVTAEAAQAEAEARLDRVEAGLLQPVPVAAAPVAPFSLGEPQSNMTRAYFEDMVVKMKDYIAAGDAFQVVPSQRLSVAFPLPPFALYRALRRINPAPFLFFLDFGDFSVAGSSPEILVRLRDGLVTIRPLAGTRPRGADPVEDKRLEEELLADPKERAEHLMLLDLGRNDVGRVAELGSVKVVESFVIERFSHVMHISSMVQGRLRPDLDALDALMAGFPAGTLSGAPKVRAMEIIEELEPVRRGIYGGCIGYFAPDGTMDTCIGLRTAVIKDGVMHVQAGGGVVADSVPALEYEESRHKARALFRAAEEAVRFATAPKNSA
ncbi:anthranilate synthase component I [Acidisoma sp. 7E03]